MFYSKYRLSLQDFKHNHDMRHPALHTHVSIHLTYVIY